jgi:hypothetical protein
MPLMRYFLFVGAALLALLFVAAEVFPTLPAESAVQGTRALADVPMIRIHTDRKWPERVVFDTSIPTIVPARTQMAKNEVSVAIPAQVAQGTQVAQVADVSTKVTARDAFAQLVPTDLKKPDPKPQQKRKIAKKRAAPPAVLLAQQQQRPQFGFFANNIW